MPSSARTDWPLYCLVHSTNLDVGFFQIDPGKPEAFLPDSCKVPDAGAKLRQAIGHLPQHVIRR